MFIEGLSDNYSFKPYYANRKYGTTIQGNFNLINIVYFIKHISLWTIKLIKERPDIAHYPITSYWNLEKGLIFLLVAKLFGAKTIAHLHGGSFDKFWSTLNRDRKSLSLKMLRYIDRLIVLSNGWKGWIFRNIAFEYEKISVVNNPIDKTFAEKALSFPEPHEPTLFFLGSIGKRKGVYDVLSVAIQLKKLNIPCKINIAGPESKKGDLAKIQNIILKNQLTNLKILQPVYGENKLNYFKQNCIFLFPSYNENFPLVIIEAAAAGKPIITTKVGALPEFFRHDESVLFVNPGDIDSIVDAVITLLSNREKRLSLGSAARDVFLNCLSKKEILKSLDVVYQKAYCVKNHYHTPLKPSKTH